MARVEGRHILADAGFPFPVLVPLQLPSREIPSSFGILSVAPAAEGEAAGAGLRVTCDARGEVTDLIRLLPAPLPGASPRHDVRGSKEPFALRVLDDRVLHWAEGRMTILDAWSVLTYPLAGGERAALESLFAVNLEGVDLPDVPAAREDAALTVFHALPVPPGVARRSLALADPPASLVASRAIDVRPAPGGSRLASRATLKGPVPPAGPGESVRRTLVFHLAMELLGAGPPRR